MRELKFRAWDKLTKQIFEVKEIDFNAIERNVYGYITTNSLFGKSDTELQWRSFDNVELMQFTGLKDKNGTDWVIVDKKLNSCMAFYPNQDREVIGNIYENGDLLK